MKRRLSRNILGAVSLVSIAGTTSTTVFGTATPSATFAIAKNGTTLGTVTANSSGTWSYTLSTPPVSSDVYTALPVSVLASYTVPAPSTTLGALSLSSASFVAGTIAGTAIGTISGKTSGSTLSLADDHSGAVALSGTSLLIGLAAPSSAGTFSITIRETLAGASNTPRDTILTITVNAALTTNFVLQEDATAFLLEDGTSRLILE